MKRSSDSYPAAKRHHKLLGETRRLIDLPCAVGLFRDEQAAQRARVKGILKNWNGEEEYELLEDRIMALIKDEEDEPLSEEMLVAILPELQSLEATTLAGMLAQYSRHMRYEAAAARLAEEAVVAVEERMSQQAARQQAMADAKLEQVELMARSKLEAVHAEAEEEAGELHGHIETLQEQLQRANAKIAKQEAELASANLRLEEALEETDLKREASKKLKEEVIENDRLTVATLNRIKGLEASLHEAKDEIEKLQDEKERAVSEGTHVLEVEEECSALKEALQDREELVVSLSQQLQQLEESSRAARQPALLSNSASKPRDSFLDRFGTFSKVFESPFGLGSPSSNSARGLD